MHKILIYKSKVDTAPNEAKLYAHLIFDLYAFIAPYGTLHAQKQQWLKQKSPLCYKIMKYERFIIQSQFPSCIIASSLLFALDLIIFHLELIILSLELEI